MFRATKQFVNWIRRGAYQFKILIPVLYTTIFNCPSLLEGLSRLKISSIWDGFANEDNGDVLG